MAGLALAAVVGLGACGGGGGGGGAGTGDPSDACTQAIRDGHNREAAGAPSPVAFLPSIQRCTTLAEWTAAANGFGIDLGGREPQFVDNTCNASGDDVKALRICQEAKASVNDPRQVP